MPATKIVTSEFFAAATAAEKPSVLVVFTSHPCVYETETLRAAAAWEIPCSGLTSVHDGSTWLCEKEMTV